MEIELKYHISDAEVFDRIIKDDKIASITDEGSYEETPMHAVYFDTDDRRLSRESMVFRVRREGRKLLGTLKWNGTSEDGMHEREEINMPLIDEAKLTEPDPDIFKQSHMWEQLTKIIGERKLKKVMSFDFMRRSLRIDSGEVICELSYDSGKVFCEGREGVISEMEIELYSGSRAEMEKIGEYLAEKYDIITENRSKFRQGLELIK